MKIKIVLLTLALLAGCAANEKKLTFGDYIDEKYKSNIENLEEVEDFEFDREAYMASGNLEDVELPAIKLKTVPFDTLNISHICKTFQSEGVNITDYSKNAKNKAIVKHIAERINAVFGCELAVQYEITDLEIYGALVSGNKIVLNTGLFTESQYIDELVFIIAHEMVHQVLVHNQQINLIGAKKTSETNRAARDIYVYLNTIAWAEVADTFMDDYKKGHYRTAHLMIPNEVTADAVAVDIMVKAGFSPQAVRYVIERTSSCLGFHDGDLNAQFAYMQKAADKFNQSKNKNMNDYFNMVDELLSQTHLPPPWRDKTISNYIKANYPAERRLRMTPIAGFASTGSNG